MWFPRLIHLIAVAICALRASSQDNDWNRQFMEMKTMMSNLESKISDIHDQLKPLDFLDYVLKVRSTDNDIASLNGRVDQMATKVDSIEESIRTLSSKQCPQSPPSRTSPPDEVNIVLKLDDYGRKMIQAHDEMKTHSQAHHQSLESFFGVVRNGFTKVINKVDSLLTMEGQMSTVASLVRQLSVTADAVSDELLSVSTDITEMKKGVTELINVNKAISDAVTEVQNTFTFPASQLGQAVEEARRLQLEMTKLNTVEDKVVKAASLSSRLLSAENLDSLTAENKEMAQNLTKYLSELEDITMPLALSVPYNFENIRAIIGDVFANLANRTQCHSDESLKLEIMRLKERIPEPEANGTRCFLDQTLKTEIMKLKDSISEHNLNETSKSKDVFEYCTASIQDLVVKETPGLDVPLLKLLSHLTILAEVREKQNSAELLGSQDRDRSLGLLLG